MMARQASPLFLEDWLRTSIFNSINNNSISRQTANSSAQAIIQAWAEVRDCLQKNAFHPRHLNSLKNLVSSQASLYVADPQAKLLVSILISPNISLPNDAYPLFIRLLYIWVRKSSKPSLSLVESAMEVIAHIFSDQFNTKKSTSLFTEGVLFIGALSFVPSLSNNAKTNCLGLLCKMLEEQYQLVGPVGGLSPDLLAGIGYGLSSSDEVHFVRLLDFLLGNWTKVEVHHDIPQALLALHLVEWVVFGLLSTGSMEKIKIFSIEALEKLKASYPMSAVLMTAAGTLRASSRPVKNGARVDIVSRLKVSAENQMEIIASNLISQIRASHNNVIEETEVNFLLQCLSLAIARSGGLNTTTGSLLRCLAIALLIEVFPLRRFYTQILKSPIGNLESLKSIGEKKHQESILFKEAGATTGVFCNLYSSANENDKCETEGLVWSFCHEVYMGHRRVALLLRGSSDQLLADLEKIAESAFLMVVVFALAVTKHRLTSKSFREIQLDISVKILVSLSCMEDFRRIRLPEYTEVIRSVAACVQDNESACVSFVESLPSYGDLTNPRELPCLQNDNYIWSKDEVQTARIMFYLRVIPTCVSRLPTNVFREVAAATMFLYMGHPNVKVTRASHSVFVSFVSSEREADQDDRNLLKEQLVFYYMQRSLEEYPQITPFDGLASGVSALVRHLPAGSPSIYYCVHSLAEKTNELCKEAMNLEGNDWWKNWQGDSEPCKKILELLFLLISMVDIQVLPELMKLLAQLIIQLPKDGQNMVLSELYAVVAESDDVTRKQTLVSWLQSLSFLCSQPTGTHKAFTEARDGENASRSRDSLSLQNVMARLCEAGTSVDIGLAAFTTSLNLLSSTLFSIDLSDPKSDFAQEFKKTTREMIDELGKLNLADYFPIFRKIDPQGIKRRTSVHFGRILHLFNTMIEQRVQRSKSMPGSAQGADVLDSLLGTDKPKTEDIDHSDLSHLLLDLFGGGIDTTTSTLEWMMAELMHSPENLKKAKKELQEIIGKGNSVEEHDIVRLPFLQAVVKETLRLHPALPFLFPERLIQM